MKYLTITIADDTGRVVDIHNIKTPDISTPHVQTNHFTDERAASEYLAGLRVIYGLTAPHSAPSTRSSGKRVKCHSTGEIFPSAAAAARSAGCSTSYMVRRIGQRADVKGSNYEYV